MELPESDLFLKLLLKWFICFQEQVMGKYIDVLVCGFFLFVCLCGFFFFFFLRNSVPSFVGVETWNPADESPLFQGSVFWKELRVAEGAMYMTYDVHKGW